MIKEVESCNHQCWYKRRENVSWRDFPHVLLHTESQFLREAHIMKPKILNEMFYFFVCCNLDDSPVF